MILEAMKWSTPWSPRAGPWRRITLPGEQVSEGSDLLDFLCCPTAVIHHRTPHMRYPSHITLEVGPRDGLQNETTPVPTDVKLQLIQRLAAAGLTHIEAGSFVSPKRVPQMADSADIVRALQPAASPLHYPVLTPNLQGFDAALAAGAREVAVFAAASESFPSAISSAALPTA